MKKFYTPFLMRVLAATKKDCENSAFIADFYDI